MNNQWDNSQDEWKLGYLAGIVDGEGSVTIERVKRKRGYQYVPRVDVNNTCFELIQLLQKEFGGVIFNLKKGGFGKPQLRLSWTGNSGKEILILVLSKLVVKRQQATLYLTFPIKTKPDTSHFSPEENLIRERIYKELKELNQRAFIILSSSEIINE